MAKKLVVISLGFLISLGLLEVGAGYWAFSKHTRNETGLGFLLRSVFPSAQQVPVSDTAVRTTDAEANPFIVKGIYSGPNFYYQIHPFIDYSGVHTKNALPARLDYFGFRNNTDLYFTRPKGKLVVLSGGSEAAGFSHREDIAKRLEKLLRKKWRTEVHVLNLAMNSYCLANEINAYVQLAYGLKPEYVVSLSGFNDVIYGLMVPPNFKRMGFSYLKQLEVWWLPRLYQLQYGMRDPVELNEVEANEVSESYFRGVNKYKQIVEGNSGRFLPLVQGYNAEFQPPRHATFHNRVEHHYRLLVKAAKGRGMISLGQRIPLEFDGTDDPVHTTDESAQMTADFIANTLVNAPNMGE